MVFQNNLLAGASGVTGAAQAPFDTTLIGNSVWFDGSDDYLNRTPSSAGNRTRWTLAWWFQLNAVATDMTFFSANVGSNDFFIRMDGTSNQQITVQDDNASGSMKTVAMQRDVGWYHCIVSLDTNQSSENDRVRVYINGELQELTTHGTFGTFNSGGETFWNNNQNHEIGRRSRTTSSYANAYMAQIVFLNADSIQNGDVAVTDFLDTFTFGTNGSQFIPKTNSDIAALATAAGGNSFCLDFADTSNFGNDISGNSPSGENDFTANNMSSANQSIHTPSRVYPKVSNIGIPGGDTAANYTMTSGSNRMVYSGSNQTYKGLISTQIIQPDDPAIYWEFYLESGSVSGNGGRVSVGLAAPSFNVGNGSGFVGAAGNNPSISRTSINDNGNVGSVASLVPTGGVQNLAYEPSTGKIWFGVNGTWNNGSATASTTLNTSSHDHQTTPQDFVFFIAAARSSDIGVLNFGDNPTFSGNETAGTNADANGHGLFKYAVPSGFLAPVSANLTAPTYQGIDYFDATLYEGNGTGQRVGDFVPFTDIGTISQSVAFNLADSDKLTIASSVSTTPTNVQKKTISVWLKPWKVGENFIMVGVNGSDSERIYTSSTGQLQYLTRGGGSSVAHVKTNGAFVADPSQWVHVVFALDYTDDTSRASEDTVKIYVNGVQITDLANTDYPANNMQDQAFINKASTEQIIGKHPSTSGGDATNFSDMYYAEYYMIDGLQLTPSTFGQLDTSTNRWVAKSTSTVTSAISSAGGFGNCGFYLNFSNTSDYGEDSSGNNRDFTESGVLDATNQFIDTPSKNFNIFDNGLNGAGTLSKGGTQIVTATDQRTTYTTMNIPATGKWYWEVDVVNYVSGGSSFFGIVEFDELVTGNNPVSGLTRQVVFDNFSGNAYVYSTSAAGTTWCNTPGNNNFNADGDILQFALDQDAGTLFIGNNNTWFRAGGARDSFANATTVGQQTFKTGVKRRFLIGRGGSFDETYAINFGQQANSFSGSSTTFNAAADGSFVYTPPTGYKAVNQDNLDDTASKITAWAWIKNRDASDSHVLIDRVRGIGVEVHTDGTTTTPETTNMNTVQRFLQRGVQVGNDVQVNTANESYVLWQWLVGDSATTGTSIGAGSISTGVPSLASTVLAADAGHFSVVSWTGNETLGATIGHGMGGEPEFIIAIARAESGENKPVYHKFMTSDNDHLKINDANAPSTAGTTIWDESAMSSTLIGLGAAVQSNSNNGMIAYCFRSIPGVCKIGKYKGTGLSSAGPYISLGFKPKWIFMRRLDSSTDAHWWTLDTVRDNDGNPTNHLLRLHANNVEGANNASLDTDFLADGFKPRSNYGGINASNGEYLYMAMADIGGNGTLPPIYGR